MKVLILSLIYIFGHFRSISARKPNIVFILADDLGYNDIGYSKYSDMDTPVLDQLASDGLKLKYSYTQFVCSPSRAAILSGIYPFRYGLQGGALELDTIGGLNPSIVLLPQSLKRLGYETHLIGKWHLGYCNQSYIPTNRGFDSFYGFLGGSEHYYTHISDNLYDYRENEKILYKEKYSTDDFGDRALDLINNASGKPKFIFLSEQAIHWPLEPPPDFRGQNVPDRDLVKVMLKRLDDSIGKIVEKLKQVDEWQNTILIFTSDNGGLPSRGGNNYPLRGAKHTLWEGGKRVRTFITGKHVPKGEYTGLFHATDWYPTIISMADGNGHALKNLDGVDQWRAIRENSRELKNQPRHWFIYNLHDRNDTQPRLNGAVRMRRSKNGSIEDYKLIIGDSGSYSGRYKVGEKEKISKQIFKTAAVFDMTLEDEIVEETPLEDRDDVKKDMLEMAEREMKKKMADVFIEKRSPKAFKITNTDGRRIMGPGWC